ncbi:MAG: QueT transporter family protein [Coriobacteriia bacterium]|nr:QueT transporter family protein [Coriobacteriia bacterium]MCL2870972.1 QueT transporter family protein [Coriobacteriia bacterium]
MEGDSSKHTECSDKSSTPSKVSSGLPGSSSEGNPRIRYIARAGLIAAVHAVATLLVLQFMSFFAWGPMQFRISEALTVLPLFFAEAVPGLTLGTFLANLINVAMTGSGALGMLDVVFGTLATLIGAIWTYRLRHRNILLALAGPVIVNALIVPAYLPIIMNALGYSEVFYQIPLLGISAAGSFALMYLFGLVSVGIGQTVVVYALGLPLARILSRITIRQN